jgi:peroxidase
MPTLAGMHTVWIREHNRIAAILLAQKPTATDEFIYQESRRIIGAMVQHITYNEWLPRILGSNLTTV